jgi:hypothetical protein
MAAMYLYLVESICHFGSCCDLPQNRFPDHSLCYIDDIVFVFAAVIVPAIAVALDHQAYVQDNRVAYYSLYPTVSFYQFSG